MIAHDTHLPSTANVVRLAPLDELPPLASPATLGLVGRTRELSDLEAQLASGARFCLITGAGGTGKTRLARTVARRSRARGSRMMEIDCTGLSSASELEGHEGEAITALLRDRARTLLVLDGVDHLDAGALAMISCWLDEAPELSIVATSRRRMTIEGARTFVLGPMPIEDAIELFIERGRAICDGDSFAGERETIAALVRRLDANPLAIELAAARLLVLTPPAILERIDDRFQLLESDRSDLPARQRSLAANISESWRELSPVEQRVLEQCAVLGGGLSLSEAEALVTAEGTPILDVLQSLVARSLISAVRRPGEGPRFTLDENMRAFALEFGAMPDEEREALAARRDPAEKIAAVEATMKTLAIDTDRRTYRVDSGSPVSLSRRRAPWLVLERLAKARVAEPGRALSVEELSVAGWPGEKILPGAAAARVYFVIRELRKSGLEDVLMTIAEGYLIDSRIRVALSAR